MAEITRKDVAKVVGPYWRKKGCYLGPLILWLIGDMFEWARAARKFTGENPAVIARNGRRYARNDPLLLLLGNKPRHEVEHRPAMPWPLVPRFMARLRTVPTRRARAAEIAILEAKRSDEIGGLWWSQIDWHLKAVKIKATPDKGGTYWHPLTERTMQILTELAHEEGRDPPWNPKLQDQRIFFKTGKQVEDVSSRNMTAYLRWVAGEDWESGLEFTLHGFRSSFSDWGRSKEYRQPIPILEMCLGHKYGNVVERAYARDPHWDERREVLEAWSQFCCGFELAPAELVLPNKLQAKARRLAEEDWPLCQEALRMAHTREAQSLWQACLMMAPRARTVDQRGGRPRSKDGVSILESKAKRLFNRCKEGTGYIGNNARDREQPWQYPSGARRPNRFPPNHPANAAIVAQVAPLNPGDPRWKPYPRGYNAGVAATLAGISRRGIIGAITSGRLAAKKTENGTWEIDPAELCRVYPRAAIAETTD